MNKRGSIALIIILIVVIVLVICVGVWYYETHDNRSVSSVSNSNTSTATIISAASVVSGFQNSIVGSDFKIVNATSGDLLWIDQDGTPIDVHIQNGLSFEGLPITVSTTPEINYASTSPEIAYSLAPMLVNSIDNYMNLHGFVLQTDQSTNETHPLIRYYEFSNAYYDAQAGVRCRAEIWPNIGPDGLSFDNPYNGDLFCADQADYQNAYSEESPFIKELGWGTSTVVSGYQICPSDSTKAIVSLAAFNGDGINYVAMKNTLQGWENADLAPAQMGFHGCF